LCENAIYHGLELRKSGGVLKISASLESNDLIIHIEDNGQGMTEEVLERVRREMDKFDPSAGTEGRKLGITNVHGRVRLYFGEDYGLTLTSWLDRGTRATLRIPARRREEDV